MAGGAGAIRAGAAYVELTADTGGFDARLAAAQARMKAFADGIKSAGNVPGSDFGRAVDMLGVRGGSARRAMSLLSETTGVASGAFRNLYYSVSMLGPVLGGALGGFLFLQDAAAEGAKEMERVSKNIKNLREQLIGLQQVTGRTINKDWLGAGGQPHEATPPLGKELEKQFAEGRSAQDVLTEQAGKTTYQEDIEIIGAYIQAGKDATKEWAKQRATARAVIYEVGALLAIRKAEIALRERLDDLAERAFVLETTRVAEDRDSIPYLEARLALAREERDVRLESLRNMERAGLTKGEAHDTAQDAFRKSALAAVDAEGRLQDARKAGWQKAGQERAKEIQQDKQIAEAEAKRAKEAEDRAKRQTALGRELDELEAEQAARQAGPGDARAEQMLREARAAKWLADELDRLREAYGDLSIGAGADAAAQSQRIAAAMRQGGSAAGRTALSRELAETAAEQAARRGGLQAQQALRDVQAANWLAQEMGRIREAFGDIAGGEGARAAAQAESIAAGMRQAEKVAGGVRGTFSGEALFGYGRGSSEPAERTASATEKMLSELKRLNDLYRQGGLEFD